MWNGVVGGRGGWMVARAWVGLGGGGGGGGVHWTRAAGSCDCCACSCIWWPAWEGDHGKPWSVGAWCVVCSVWSPVVSFSHRSCSLNFSPHYFCSCRVGWGRVSPESESVAPFASCFCSSHTFTRTLKSKVRSVEINKNIKTVKRTRRQKLTQKPSLICNHKSPPNKARAPGFKNGPARKAAAHHVIIRTDNAKLHYALDIYLSVNSFVRHR